MTSPRVNGETPHGSPQSAFLQHVLGYPVVHDSIETFKSNPYGQKSIALGDSAYQTFAKPVLPYLSVPYQYVSPYVNKADDLGERTLSRVDERFPIIRKQTDELYQDARQVALYPYRVGMAGKDHILEVFSESKSKAGGNSVITLGRAAFSTAVIVSLETLSTVGSILSSKKQQQQTAPQAAPHDGLNGTEKAIN